MELLKIGNGFIPLVQLALNLHYLLHVLQLITFHLEFDNVSSMKVSENKVISSGLGNLVETMLELAHTTHMNVILGCSALELIFDLGVLVEDMTVADPKYVVTGFTAVILVFVHPQGKSALGVILLHLLGVKGNSEQSSEEPANIVGGFSAVDMLHEWGA